MCFYTEGCTIFSVLSKHLGRGQLIPFLQFALPPTAGPKSSRLSCFSNRSAEIGKLDQLALVEYENLKPGTLLAYNTIHNPRGLQSTTWTGQKIIKVVDFPNSIFVL